MLKQVVHVASWLFKGHLKNETF